MNLLKIMIKSVLSLFLISLFSLVSCVEDEPLEPREENSYGEGIVIYSVGTKIAEIFNGKTTDMLQASVTGFNKHMNVKFFDTDKNIVEPPDDEDIKFAWAILNDNLLEIFHDPRIERQYGFIFIGKAEGLTEIEFFLLKNGSKVFSSGSIPVFVNN